MSRACLGQSGSKDKSTRELAAVGVTSLVLGAGSSSAAAQSVSSNCFASGANQNAGNVITDRSTTRIHHAPGGASSICLGDGSSDGMFTKRSLATPKSAAHAQSGASQPTNSQTTKTPQQIYAEELRMQIETKKAMAAGKKAADLQAERADEFRVQKEAAELQAQVDDERARQREREVIVDQRSNQ